MPEAQSATSRFRPAVRFPSSGVRYSRGERAKPSAKTGNLPHARRAQEI